jgi:hypothetical protein
MSKVRRETPKYGDRVHRKLPLAVEVIGAYVPLRRAVRHNDLRAMVRTARTPRRGRVAVPSHDHAAIARRLGCAVRRTLEPLPTDTRCLVRSLVLVRLLERRSVAATLVIGVNHQQDGTLTAHAWVEHQGSPVLPAGSYERLIEI